MGKNIVAKLLSTERCSKKERLVVKLYVWLLDWGFGKAVRLLVVCKFLYHLPVVGEDCCAGNKTYIFALVDYHNVVVF